MLESVRHDGRMIWWVAICGYLSSSDTVFHCVEEKELVDGEELFIQCWARLNFIVRLEVTKWGTGGRRGVEGQD